MSLQQASAYSVGEMNKSYTPLAAGKAPKLTLYKDCMENQGFTKVGSDEVKLEWIENTGRKRLVDPAACNDPHQTCIVF